MADFGPLFLWGGGRFSVELCSHDQLQALVSPSAYEEDWKSSNAPAIEVFDTVPAEQMCEQLEN